MRFSLALVCMCAVGVCVCACSCMRAEVEGNDKRMCTSYACITYWQVGALVRAACPGRAQKWRQRKRTLVNVCAFRVCACVCVYTLTEVANLHIQTNREESHAVRYRVGQLFVHKRYRYSAVIVGWDTTCEAEEEWLRQMVCLCLCLCRVCVCVCVCVRVRVLCGWLCVRPWV